MADVAACGLLALAHHQAESLLLRFVRGAALLDFHERQDAQKRQDQVTLPPSVGRVLEQRRQLQLELR